MNQAASFDVALPDIQLLPESQQAGSQHVALSDDSQQQPIPREARVLIFVANSLGWVQPLNGQASVASRFVHICGAFAELLLALLMGISAYMKFHAEGKANKDLGDTVEDLGVIILPVFAGSYFVCACRARMTAFGGPSGGLMSVLRTLPLALLRRHLSVAVLFTLSAHFVNIGLAIIFIKSTDSFQPLGPVFQYQALLEFWCVTIVLDITGVMATIALLQVLPSVLHQKLSAADTAVTSGDFVKCKELYGTFLQCQQSARPAYQAVANPFIVFGVLGTALLLSEEIRRFYGRSRSNIIDEVWLSLTVGILIWLTVPAAELPRLHKRFLSSVARMACAEPSCARQREAMSELVSLLALTRDSVGLRLAGQVVTYRFLLTLLTAGSAVFTFMGKHMVETKPA